MFADHLVLGIFTDLTKAVIPVAFYVLGAFVCAFRISYHVLSMVYIAQASRTTTGRVAEARGRNRNGSGERKREGGREALDGKGRERCDRSSPH